jgi:apolipoprotein N-acyltransferase
MNDHPIFAQRQVIQKKNNLIHNKYANIREDIYSNYKAYLWLLIGFLFLPFTFFQTVFPLAGWLAPVFLLRFSRTFSGRTRSSSHLLFYAYAGALFIANRTLPFNWLGVFGNILFKGLVWMLPYTIDRFLSQRLKGWSRTFIFPLAFTSVDWMLSKLIVSSSASPSYSQAGNLALLQILSITGMWAITFLIGWFASLFNSLWENGFQWRPLHAEVILYLCLLVAALGYGGLRLNSTSSPSATLKAAMITIDESTVTQATNAIDWATLSRASLDERSALRPRLSATVDEMLARSETALGGGANLIAWQESSAWVLEEDKAELLEHVSTLAKRYGAYLQISLEVITHSQSMKLLRNQSILIDPTGQVLWTYNKTHPDPYGEAIVTLAGSGTLPIADTPDGHWTTAICYDTYFPDLMRQAGKNQATLLFAPTNDVSQFAESALSMAAYRAIENGVTILRPTGNGISAIIDDRGRILFSQDYFANQSGVIATDLPLQGARTIYSQIGDVFAYLCVAGLAYLTIMALLFHKRPVSTAHKQPVV